MKERRALIVNEAIEVTAIVREIAMTASPAFRDNQGGTSGARSRRDRQFGWAHLHPSLPAPAPTIDRYRLGLGDGQTTVIWSMPHRACPN